eukprot:scaffold549_cov174-Ochromonas_danica.AAC.8
MLGAVLARLMVNSLYKACRACRSSCAKVSEEIMIFGKRMEELDTLTWRARQCGVVSVSRCWIQ